MTILVIVLYFLAVVSFVKYEDPNIDKTFFTRHFKEANELIRWRN